MTIPGSQEPDCEESKDLGCSLNSLYKMTASLETGRLDVFDTQTKDATFYTWQDSFNDERRIKDA